MACCRLLIHSIRQVVQVTDNENILVLKGDQMRNIVVLEQEKNDGEGYSIVVNGAGIIECVDKDNVVKARYKDVKFEKTIDASGKAVIPGLVDGHTHAVWAGDRVNEFAMKLGGATYMDIHKSGGGIHYTVDCVRKASEDELYEAFKREAQMFIQAGTTMLECKSGYGLDTESEIKMLKVLERAKSDSDVHVEISSTYCGAHAVPKGSTAESATEDILNTQLPEIHKLITDGLLHVDNIDVFCEKGVFDVEQTRKILVAGQKIGMAVNFHGEELNLLHSAEMGSEISARAISHLEEVSPAGIKAMSESGTIAVILPTTAYILRLKRPPVRDMISAGVAVCLGSDFNPNAHCRAMPIVMHLACVLLEMSMEEALVASTINAAASLGKSRTHGSIQPGKVADMLILDAPRWEHIVYQFGSYHDVISHVIKDGHVVNQKNNQ